MPFEKVQKISKNLTPFAGIFYVNDEFKRSGLCKLIDNQLGSRASTKGYSYGNMFANFFNLFLSGGECAEDLHEYFRPTLEQFQYHKQQQTDTACQNTYEFDVRTGFDFRTRQRYKMQIELLTFWVKNILNPYLEIIMLRKKSNRAPKRSGYQGIFSHF